MMAGALDSRSVEPELLSYEGPFGVGYAVGVFTAGAEDPGKFLGAQGGEHIGQQVYGARGQGKPVYRGHGELPLL